MIEYAPNPAKAFLARYRYLLTRRAALLDEVTSIMERATDISAKLRPVVAASGASDKLGEIVAAAVDAQAGVLEASEQIDAQLREVLAAIEAVPDERQRLVLTLRYVRGLSWTQIQEAMHYERTQVYVLHGRALAAVREWMMGHV